MSTAESRPIRPSDWGVAAYPFLHDVSTRPRRERPQRRRTRIVSTIGPASDSPVTIAAMAAAGMDVARVTFAHGPTKESIERIRRIHAAAPEVAILVDLPGPKVRSTPFPEGGVVLTPGEEVLLLPGSLAPTSSATEIGVRLDEIALGLEEGDPVKLGDGGISLVCLGRGENGIWARVRAGGRVQGSPGFTVPTSRVTLATPTPEDFERIAAVLQENVEYLALSFVREVGDLQKAKAAIGDSPIMLVAKIETAEAIAHLDEILTVTDAVMVARGDLGVRVPIEDVPLHQKEIIRSGVRFGRPVITATQMLESMVTAIVPTRAEVTDVANAVLDGTSAVMLSGETAIGVDPILAVETMARIVLRTEQSFDYARWGAGVGLQVTSEDPFSNTRITAAITGAAWRAALEEDAAAIIACTRSGATARAISRFRPRMPIVGATPSIDTARQLKMSWGVDAIVVRESKSTDDVVWFAVQGAVEAGYAASGDILVVLAGSPTEDDPVADTLRIVRVK